MMINKKDLYLFDGFDNSGEVFQYKHDIYRSIYQGHEKMLREVFNICKINDLFRIGVVETKIIKKNIFPELKFGLLLQHKKIPFISYPHEWSTEMFKDATIFHIDLFEKLNKYELFIKDWHPLNIVFDFNRPIFVDFTSIIPKKLLKAQEYLKSFYIPFYLRSLLKTDSTLIYKMYQHMFIPYFLLPLYMMTQKKYSLAHKRIYETTLHTNRKAISENEVFGLNLFNRLRYKFCKFQKELDLLGSTENNYSFFKQLKNDIYKLTVSPKKSNYADYYERKKENLNFDTKTGWTKKQIIIDEVIKKYKPKTVLDIGCNTGWFSILAAKRKCEVVAIDIDEACVNQLYLKAKRNNYSILPLVLDIVKYPQDTYSIPYKNEKNKREVNHKFPLLQSADRRLKCDMVMVLALLHHLILGQNHNFSQIISILDSFTGKYLILEFVLIDDELIQNEPEFFPAYKEKPNNFKFYNLKNLILELKKYYKSVIVLPTDSMTRSLVICTK